MKRLFLTILFTASVLVFPGCPQEEHGHMSANLSLVEIGERSLESAERAGSDGQSQ